jgi:hypothetical protein
MSKMMSSVMRRSMGRCRPYHWSMVSDSATHFTGYGVNLCNVFRLIRFCAGKCSFSRDELLKPIAEADNFKMGYTASL